MDVAEAVGELLTGAGRDDPYPVYETIRAYGPLARVQQRFLVATGYGVVDEILRDPRMLVESRELAAFYGTAEGPALSEEIVLGRSILRSNPPDHTRMRRLAAGAFTPRRLEGIRATVVEQVQTLTGYLEHIAAKEAAKEAPKEAAKEPVDAMAEFAYPLPIRVICALLGVPAADQQWFRTQADALTTVLEPSQLLEGADEAVQARSRLDLYLSDLVERRRKEPADDLTTALVQISDANPEEMSARELTANLVLLLVAGFETTANLIGNGLAILLRRPELADTVARDPGRFVDEVLRYDSPVQLTSRWCREEIVVDGVRLEPYSQIMLLVGAANRDPARFASPDVFNPARPQNQPLSFGAGAHYCLGAALARMEAEIAFRTLAGCKLTLAGEPVRRGRLTLRGYAELPVTISP